MEESRTVRTCALCDAPITLDMSGCEHVCTILTPQRGTLFCGWRHSLGRPELDLETVAAPLLGVC